MILQGDEDEAERQRGLHKLLGQVISRERGITTQRVLARRAGVAQQNISDYEVGRRTPSWETFVRILAAMDLRPIVETAPVYRHPKLFLSAEKRLRGALAIVLDVLGDRTYRVEGEVAAYLHGDHSAQIDTLVVGLHGDPDNLDEVSRVVARDRQVTAVREPGYRSFIKFMAAGVEVGIFPAAEPRSSIPIAHEGMVVPVAPATDIVRLPTYR